MLAGCNVNHTELDASKRAAFSGDKKIKSSTSPKDEFMQMAISAAGGDVSDLGKLRSVRQEVEKLIDTPGAPVPTSVRGCIAERADSLDVAVGQAPVFFARDRSGRLQAWLGFNGSAREKGGFVLDESNPMQWLTLDQAKTALRGAGVLLRPRNKAEPNIWISYDKIDLGNIRKDISEKKIAVVNSSAVAVRIVSADFNCSCGSAEFENLTLPPFGSTKAKVRLNTLGKRAGPLELLAVIKTDPAIVKNRPIRISGNVIRPTQVDPKSVTVGTVSPESDPVLVKAVVRLSEQRKAAVKPAYLPEGITWQGATVMNDGNLEIAFNLDPSRITVSNPSGNFDLAVALEVSLAPDTTEQETLVLPFSIAGKRVQAVQLAPDEIFLGVCEPGAELNRSVRVFSAKHGSTGALSAIPATDAPVKTKVEGDTIQVGIRAPTRPGMFRSVVFVRLSDSFGLLPISGIVSEHAARPIEPSKPTLGTNIKSK